MRQTAITISLISLAAAALATAGCVAAPRTGPAAPGSGDAAADRAFVERAAREGLAEVKLGELAADQAQDPRVKALARGILDDYKQTNGQLQALAAAKGIPLPAEIDHQEAWDYRQLARLCCYEFNRYYVNMMADYHIADVRRFRREAARTADPELRRFAAANLRLMKDHRNQAQLLVPWFGHGRTDGGDAPQ